MYEKFIFCQVLPIGAGTFLNYLSKKQYQKGSFFDSLTLP